MKYLLLGLIFFSFNVNAKVIFFNLGNKVMFLLQAQDSDTDVKKLYDSMDSGAVDLGEYYSKTIEMRENQNKILTLNCMISKTITNYGSCNLKLFHSSYLEINMNQGWVYFDMAGQIARTLGELFNHDTSGSVFTSQDGSLSLRKNLSGQNTADFYISFNK